MGLSVNITEDTLPEMNETLLLNLTSDDGITNVTDESVILYILNNGKFSQVWSNGRFLWSSKILFSGSKVTLEKYYSYESFCTKYEIVVLSTNKKNV